MTLSFKMTSKNAGCLSLFSIKWLLISSILLAFLGLFAVQAAIEYPGYHLGFKGQTNNSLIRNIEKRDVVDAGHTLGLTINLKATLAIQEEQIAWRIEKHGEIIRRLRGNNQSLRLAAGTYQVYLQIDHYHIRQSVQIEEAQYTKLNMKAKLGRLSLKSDQAINWNIQPDQASVTYKAKQSYRLDRIVAAGEYQVTAYSSLFTYQESIYVPVDKHITRKLNIPMGSARLIAIGNEQPLLKTVNWEVFQLRNNQRELVGKYNLNTTHIQMPPGQYEAIAKYRKHVSKRRFWLQDGVVNDVTLAFNE